MTNITRQALAMAPACSSAPSMIPMRAAIMLPIVEAACTHPSANGRARSGSDSATSATPTANWPPTPRPVRKRYDGEVPDSRRQRAQAGEDRVEQNRDDHGLHAADAIAEDAEDQPAARPPDHENHRGVAGVFRNRAASPASCRSDVQQFRDRRAACQLEQLLVHRVEQPAERRRQQNEPVIRGQLTVPSAGRGGRGWSDDGGRCDGLARHYSSLTPILRHRQKPPGRHRNSPCT